MNRFLVKALAIPGLLVALCVPARPAQAAGWDYDLAGFGLTDGADPTRGRVLMGPAQVAEDFDSTVADEQSEDQDTHDEEPKLGHRL